MGCGGGVKETNETVRKQPFSQTKIQPGVRRMATDVRGKLPPEVLDGFAKIIKSFYNVGPPKPAMVTSRPADKLVTKPGLPASNGTTDSHGLSSDKEKGEVEAKRRAEIEAEEARRAAEFAGKQVANPFQDLLKGEKNRAVEEEKMAEERRRMEEQRFSPEPPRPEELSDEEVDAYEDPEMRRARLEKERLAKEEAERRAAQLRLEEERVAAQRKGAMNNMQSEADSILSKYQ